jgi:hypothetical protein
MAGWLMLLFIMVTLYDAQFPIYDTFIGRTTTDAIAVTRQRQGALNNFFHRLLPAGLRNRPYRFWYFVVVTAAVLAGLWMVLQTSPFIIWLAGSVAYLINQGRHPDHADQQSVRTGSISGSTSSLRCNAERWAAVGIWLYAGGLAEIIRRWQAAARIGVRSTAVLGGAAQAVSCGRPRRFSRDRRSRNTRRHATLRPSCVR